MLTSLSHNDFIIIGKTSSIHIFIYNENLILTYPPVIEDFRYSSENLITKIVTVNNGINANVFRK